ncbi:MAG TPA: CHASE4 domain-containing protein [Arenimonas sp.]|nr:CHASE4 domain-containing protein [Arenimonas sp.]HOZ05142.1 CHASE4 domain-containing protein [Arenimonas sp.]HPW32688.1 CHASE4 domain-containing protein [Arenimonas sp.]
MRLRTRTISLVFFFVTLAALSLTLTGRYYLYPKFIQLEDEQAIRNANIGLELLNSEVNFMADRPPDWGYWDDTYQFVLDRNREYITSNLEAGSQISLQANLIAIYDRQGNKVWARAMLLDTQEIISLDEYELEKLPLSHPMLSHEDSPTTRAGIMNSSYGPIFLASTPILHSDRTGSSQGTFIFGRLFDPAKIRRIATQAGLELTLSPHIAGKTELRPASRKKEFARLQHTPLIISRTDKLTQVTTTLFSIDDKPIIDMLVSMPSDITKRGKKTLDGITIAIFLAGLFLSLILTYLLNRSVIAPISRITKHLAHIGNQEDIAARIKLERNDEIGDLANEFDQMLQRLSDTRKRLFKQSYQSGASEMASGVIQDINKNIQPLRENIELPISLLDRAHTSTSAGLIHELADIKVGNHRFIEITQQLLDLNNEQALLLAEARSEMRRLRIDIEQLQEVISDYSKFISQGSDTGVVSVSSLLNTASKKLSADEKKLLTIDIDPAVYRVAPAAASPNLLQQVINVLLDHYVSAAEQLAATPLHLRITCRTEVTQGSARLHFCFDDDRARMTNDEFSQYLSENWSSANIETGLNLPWAETAVTSMLGKLYAEPSQLLDGVAIHLILPRAKLDEK